MESDVKVKEREVKANEKDYSKDKQCHENCEKKLAMLEKSMETLGYREGQMEELQEKRYAINR